jgi:HEAT repeat protein
VDEIERILGDRSLRAKAVVEGVAAVLLGGSYRIDDYVALAEQQRGARKSNLVEALELATKSKPDLVNDRCLDFLAAALLDKEPRTKWEAARVIANCCGTCSGDLRTAVENLQQNARHEGTVVRWSVALALSEIARRSGYPRREELLEQIRENEAQEEKASIKKIYAAVLKRT